MMLMILSMGVKYSQQHYLRTLFLMTLVLGQATEVLVQDRIIKG